MQEKNQKYTLYIAMSLDGYIADKQGGVEWLNSFDDGHGEAHTKNYLNFLASIDSILMGRITYEQILTFGSWPYDGKETYILTRNQDQPFNFGKAILPDKNQLREKIQGQNIWILGGAQTLDLCLEWQIAEELIITVMPIILGSGIKLFKEKSEPQWLELEDVCHTGSVVELKYRTKF